MLFHVYKYYKMKINSSIFKEYEYIKFFINKEYITTILSFDIYFDTRRVKRLVAKTYLEL